MKEKEKEAFVDQIAENPHDDTVFHIFADYLMDHDHPLGEVVKHVMENQIKERLEGWSGDTGNDSYLKNLPEGVAPSGTTILLGSKGKKTNGRNSMNFTITRGHFPSSNIAKPIVQITVVPKAKRTGPRKSSVRQIRAPLNLEMIDAFKRIDPKLPNFYWFEDMDK